MRELIPRRERMPLPLVFFDAECGGVVLFVFAHEKSEGCPVFILL
jgi:hypothetical protein